MEVCIFAVTLVDGIKPMNRWSRHPEQIVLSWRLPMPGVGYSVVGNTWTFTRKMTFASYSLQADTRSGYPTSATATADSKPFSSALDAARGCDIYI